MSGAAYGQPYALWSEAIQAIQKYGPMVKSPSGFPMQSPYVAVANKQAELMIRIGAEFGLTPSSRSRISVPPRSLQNLPGAKYLDRNDRTDLADYLASNPSRYFND